MTAASAPSPVAALIDAPARMMSDQALMRRVAGGDQLAFAEIYRRHAGPAHRVAESLCAGHGDDIVQDVFLRIWQQPERFDLARGGLRTYTTMKARSRAIDVLRSSGSRRAREQSLEGAQRAAHAPDPQTLSDGAGSEALQLLATLPAPQRDAIVLAYYGGCTYREAAKLLGRPEGTVKSQIRTGLSRLRADITESGRSSSRPH